MHDQEGQQDKSGKSDDQIGEVNEGKKLVLHDIPQGQGEELLYHCFVF
jgi:hypothetical protein